MEEMVITEMISGTKCVYSSPIPVNDDAIVDNEVYTSMS